MRKNKTNSAHHASRATQNESFCLVELTRCQKEESARKPCQQVLAIANRFFETVARINEGPLGENRGDFGGKPGKNGGNRGILEENRDIFGLNQDTSGANNGDPDLSKMTYSQYSRILAILAEDVDENEPMAVQARAPASPCRLPTSPGLRPGRHDKKTQNKPNLQNSKKTVTPVSTRTY